MDFYSIKKVKYSRGSCDYEIKPKFNYLTAKDIACKGGELYAFWDNERKVWDTSLVHLINKIDDDVRKEYEAIKNIDDRLVLRPLYMNDDDSGVMDRFKRFTGNCAQSDAPFDSKIIFKSDPYVRENYSTFRLSYDPTPGSTEAFDTLLDKLYEPAEKRKILWFMGLLLTGNSAKVQKFMFLHGGKGTGKGTVINIFKEIFADYYSNINLQTLTSDSQFATEGVKEIPLLVDEDCDMSNIKKDTNLLKLTAHEPILVNKKYMKPYPAVFNGVLITASNQAYKVRDIDSGIMRRAVTVYPSNRTFDLQTYHQLMDKIKFEVPAIAQKAIDAFNEMGIAYYNSYEDKRMAAETDYFLDFMREKYEVIKETMVDYEGCIPGSILSNFYYDYLTDNEWQTSGYKKKVRSQAKRYFRKSYDKKKIDGKTYRNVYEELLIDKMFDVDSSHIETHNTVERLLDYSESTWIKLAAQHSLLDDVCADLPAQYANENGTPSVSWNHCKTKLSDLDTAKLHYLLLPVWHIVIDFDLTNENGEKDLLKNIEAASTFPKTYAEVSKSGNGLHLHYFFDGDNPERLMRTYDEGIEIKVYSGKSSLRRALTLCNDIPIAHISTGLPYKEDDKMYKNADQIVLNDKGLHTLVENAIARKYNDHTTPSINLIATAINTAKENGVKYDLSDLKQHVVTFARHSTNQSDYCLGVVRNLEFSNVEEDDFTVSGDYLEQDNTIYPDSEITIFDIEVFPNTNFIVTKKMDEPCVVWLKPKPKDIEEILKMRLIGFNNLKYDNYILWGMLHGKTPEETFALSNAIINGNWPRGCGIATGWSYSDLYDFLSEKKSLKAWEIEMADAGRNVKHDELEFDFTKPLPDEYLDRAIEYCIHDVEATEELLKYKASDWETRKILSTLSGCSPNIPNNAQVAKLLFGDERNPEKSFVYTDLSKTFPGYRFMRTEGHSFPKDMYKYKNPKPSWNPKSFYMGEDPSEGGYVWAEPGVYFDVTYEDIQSLHPNSLINMNYFGKYTKGYEELLQARLHIKHGEYDKCAELFDGRLVPFLQDEEKAAGLNSALKIVLNSVYGMTSAKFPNKFKHPDNVDNIVAKRGALFMIKLKNAIQQKGFIVAHIKTDSIKVPNATDELRDFMYRFAEQYGYSFEHQTTFKRMALINRAVLIGQREDGSWEAVGAQFAQPYVYKTLFDTSQKINSKDFLITKQVKSAIYLGNVPDNKDVDIADFEFVGRIARIYASKTGTDIIRYDREKGTYAYVTGTKGYKWKLASELTDMDDVDFNYYDKLIEDAIEAINKVGPSGEIIDDPRGIYSDLLTYY